MDKILRETTNLCVKTMNSERQVKGKLDHMVQIRISRKTWCDANVMLNFYHKNTSIIKKNQNKNTRTPQPDTYTPKNQFWKKNRGRVPPANATVLPFGF